MNSVFSAQKHHTMAQRLGGLSYDCSSIVIKMVGGFSLLSVILCGSDGKWFGAPHFYQKDTDELEAVYRTATKNKTSIQDREESAWEKAKIAEYIVWFQTSARR